MGDLVDMGGICAEYREPDGLEAPVYGSLALSRETEQTANLCPAGSAIHEGAPPGTRIVVSSIPEAG